MKLVGTGILEAISTRSDGSFKLIIGTNEINASNAANLFEMRNQFLKYVFSNNNITPLDEQLLDELKIKDGKKVKTQSQRLRAVIFKVWEISGSPLEFDSFYHNETEKHIDTYKRMLD